jgi:hypothetical protein
MTMEALGTKKLCRDLWRYSTILSQTTDARAIRVLRELIVETEERLFAIEEAAELATE